MNRISRIGYVLCGSGAMSAVLYPVQSWIADWQSFSILVELGFVCVALLGLALGLFEAKTVVGGEQAKFHMDRTLFIGNMLTGMGMLGLAFDLAYREIASIHPGTTIWIGILIASAVLFVLGLAITSLGRNTTREAKTELGGERTSERQ